MNLAEAQEEAEALAEAGAVVKDFEIETLKNENEELKKKLAMSSQLSFQDTNVNPEEPDGIRKSFDIDHTKATGHKYCNGSAVEVWSGSMKIFRPGHVFAFNDDGSY